MKRVLLVLAICVALGLVFGSGASAQKMIRIGEHQIVSHPALDNDSKGFAAALKRKASSRGKISPLIAKMPRAIRPTARSLPGNLKMTKWT